MLRICLVASLGSVSRSPGAATDGVTPIFPLKKLATFFSHRYKVMTFFSCRLLTTPQLPSSDIVLPSVLCKFSHNFFAFGCHSPGWCHPGRSAPPLVIGFVNITDELRNNAADNNDEVFLETSCYKMS